MKSKKHERFKTAMLIIHYCQSDSKKNAERVSNSGIMPVTSERRVYQMGTRMKTAVNIIQIQVTGGKVRLKTFQGKCSDWGAKECNEADCIQKGETLTIIQNYWNILFESNWSEHK